MKPPVPLLMGEIREFSMPVRGGLRYRPILPGDVDFLVTHMRAVDHQGVFPFTGVVDIKTRLTETIECSAMALTAAAADGEPVSIIGLVRISNTPGAGYPWMVSTERVRFFPRALLADARRILAEMQAICPYLINFINTSNDSYLQWLRHLGFTVYHAAPFGVLGNLHHRFDIHADAKHFRGQNLNYLH